MPAVIDPVSGLELYELSHRWGMYTPIFPGYEEIKLERITHHAKQGVMTHKITTIFHTSTHLNAPIHLVPGAPAVGDLELQKFFGTGVVVSIPKRKWGLIEPSDLERAKPQIKAGDIVLINTGWHRKYADSKEYFGYAPGLSKHAAEWLVKKRVKLVGVDTACVDHPLATSLGPHRNGPQIKYLLAANTRKPPAARRSRISRNGMRRIARCSKPAFRPSRMSAAISMSSAASAAPSRAFRGNGMRAMPA